MRQARLSLGLRIGSGWVGVCIGWALAGGAARVAAAEPGDAVVVVYNSRLPESQQVAAHYAAVRRVPAGQVLGLDLPAGENMTRAEYREELATAAAEIPGKGEIVCLRAGRGRAGHQHRGAEIEGSENSLRGFMFWRAAAHFG